MNKRALVYLLILVIISLCACESDIPLYKARESKKSLLVKSDYKIEDFYMPDTNIIDSKKTYTKIVLDTNAIGDIEKLIDNAINCLFNLSYAQDGMDKLEQLYSLTSLLLEDSIKKSNYFSYYKSYIEEYEIVFNIPYRYFSDDGYVIRYALDGNNVYAVPVQIYIETYADDSFYEKYEYYVKGDTRIILWFYILPVEESQYEIIAWTENFFNNEDKIKTLVFSEKEVSYE